MSTTEDRRMPRLYGSTFHGRVASDLLQFDYIEIAPSTSGDKYVLMLPDDNSGYRLFFVIAENFVENAAEMINDWCTSFGVPKLPMSDDPKNFRNETIKRLIKEFKVPHYFSLPYTP